MGATESRKCASRTQRLQAQQEPERLPVQQDTQGSLSIAGDGPCQPGAEGRKEMKAQLAKENSELYSLSSYYKEDVAWSRPRTASELTVGCFEKGSHIIKRLGHTDEDLGVFPKGDFLKYSATVTGIWIFFMFYGSHKRLNCAFLPDDIPTSGCPWRCPWYLAQAGTLSNLRPCFLPG